MAINVSDPSLDQNYETPPDGLQLAVLCDVVDLGLCETPWGNKHKVKLKWQLESTRSDGSRHIVSKRYTASLHKKAALRQDLEGWRNKRFSDEELKGFDLERLIGLTCQLQIMHVSNEDRTYANVERITMAPNGNSLEIQDYTREQDRDYSQGQEKTNGGGGFTGQDEPPADAYDDLPF